MFPYLRECECYLNVVYLSVSVADADSTRVLFLDVWVFSPAYSPSSLFTSLPPLLPVLPPTLLLFPMPPTYPPITSQDADDWA